MESMSNLDFLVRSQLQVLGLLPHIASFQFAEATHMRRSGPGAAQNRSQRSWASLFSNPQALNIPGRYGGKDDVMMTSNPNSILHLLRVMNSSGV